MVLKEEKRECTWEREKERGQRGVGGAKIRRQLRSKSQRRPYEKFNFEKKGKRWTSGEACRVRGGEREKGSWHDDPGHDCRGIQEAKNQKKRGTGRGKKEKKGE